MCSRNFISMSPPSAHGLVLTQSVLPLSLLYEDTEQLRDILGDHAVQDSGNQPQSQSQGSFMPLPPLACFTLEDSLGVPGA